MPLDSEQMQKIIVDVTLDNPAPQKESAEAADFRKRIAAEVADAKEQGLVVDFTPEIPSLD